MRKFLFLAVVAALVPLVVFASTDDYEYYSAVIVTNSTGSPLVSYPVAVQVNALNLVTGGYIQSDGGDIYPTDEAGAPVGFTAGTLGSNSITWWLDASLPGLTDRWDIHTGDATADRDQSLLLANSNAYVASGTEILRPNTVGDLSALTPTGCTSNWQCVDEVTADGDTSYVMVAAAASGSDLYELSATALTGQTISTVTVWFESKQSSSPVGTVTPTLKLAGVTVTGTPQTVTASYVAYSEVLSRPGGGPWLVSDLSSLQAGTDLDNTGGAGETRVTQVYVSIAYTNPVSDSITVSDHADLDFTTNFAVQADAILYAEPTAGSWLVEKVGAYRLGWATSGSLAAEVYTAYGATETLRPDSAGSSTALTPSGCTSNWQCVDEVTADDYTTYNETSFNGTETDYYGLQATGLAGDETLTEVRAYFRVQDNTDGVCTATPILRLSAVDTSGTSVTTGSWATFSEALGRPGGGSWSVSDLDALQVGTTLSMSGGSSGGCRITQEYVTITYDTSYSVSVAATYDQVTGPSLVYDGETLTVNAAQGIGASVDLTGTVNNGSSDVVVGGGITGGGISGLVDSLQFGSTASYISNSSFEVASPALSGWTAWSSATGTSARSTSERYHGEASLETVMTDSTAAGKVLRRYQDLAAVEGEVWSVGVWVKPTALAADGTQVSIRREFRDAALVVLLGGSASTATVGSWQRLEALNLAAPAGTTWLRISLDVSSGGVGSTGTAYFDGVTAAKESTLPEWPDIATILEYEFEPLDLNQTQQGTAANGWTWLGTVEDISTGGVDHDGAFTFVRDQTGIDASPGGLVNKTSYTPGAAGEDIYPVMFGAPTPIPGYYEETSPITSLPYYDLFQPAAIGLGWSTNTFYGLMAIFIGIAVGVGVLIATGSILLAIAAVGAGLAGGAGAGILGWWVVVVYSIIAGSYLVSSRSM